MCVCEAAAGREEALKLAISERQALLEAAQAALARTAAQMQEVSADRDAKLKTAFEVSASLKAVLRQKDAQLAAAKQRAAAVPGGSTRLRWPTAAGGTGVRFPERIAPPDFTPCTVVVRYASKGRHRLRVTPPPRPLAREQSP